MSTKKATFKKQGKKSKLSTQKLPQKPWKKDNKKEKKAVDGLLKKAGGQGTNIDAVVNEVIAPSEGVQIGEATTMQIEVQMVDAALAKVALGIVLRAIKLGWLSTFTQDSPPGQPFNAYRYIIDVLTSACDGGVSLVQHAPMWFWEIIYALTPKSAKFKTGMVSYSTQLSVVQNWLNPQMDGIGGVTIEFGVLTNSVLDGWPILADSAYDPAEGPGALSSLFAVFGDQGLNVKTAEPGAEQTIMSKDTSAFTAQYPEIGISNDGDSGMATTLYSERFINCPIFAKFVGYQSGIVWRGYQELRHSGGSGSYLGTRLSELPTKRLFSNKISPVFKMVNFDEYFEQFAYVIGGMQEKASQYTAFDVIIPYPLSAQKAKLMLRQALIPLFCNEMAQDLVIPAGDATQGFVPFSVGMNGNATGLSGIQPIFTQFFAEGARAIHRITANIGGFGVLDIIPILGAPQNIGAVPTNYVWHNSRTDAVEQVFQPQTESTIDLWSCKATIGPNTFYLDLNGTELGSIILTHNDWMKTMSTFSTGQISLASEKGISALNVLDVTLISGVNLGGPTITTTTIGAGKGSQNIRKKVSRADSKYKFDKNIPTEIGEGTVRTKLSAQVNPDGPTYMGSTAMKTYVSNLPQMAAAWKYKQAIVCPTYLVSIDVFDGTTVSYQANQCEPYSIPVTNTPQTFFVGALPDTYYHLQDKHEFAASLDLRTGGSSVESEVERDLNSLGAAGRGGFFCHLAGELAGALGWQGGKDIADTVGALTGL